MESLAGEYALRTGSDKSAEVFERIDDKWLFTRTYFLKLARELDFCDVEVIALGSPGDKVRHQTLENLSVGLELGPEALPDWAWNVIEKYDRSFSPEQASELVCAGAVVLTVP